MMRADRRCVDRERGRGGGVGVRGLAGVEQEPSIAAFGALRAGFVRAQQLFVDGDSAFQQRCGLGRLPSNSARAPD